MGKQTSAPPPVPDPYKTAQAQTGSNVNTAIANAWLGNANEIGPYGSVTYEPTAWHNVGGSSPWGNYGSGGGGGMDGGGGGYGNGGYRIPQFTRRVTLSPEQQKLYDQQNQLGRGLNQLAIGQTGKLTNWLDRPVDTAGLPSVANDFSADRSSVEQAMFDRLNPQLERDRASLENSLVNQGFQRGTEAFSSGMDQYNRQANDQRLGITAAGLQEQQGLFGMAQGNRQRALQETLALRNQPINEISALMSGGQVSLPQAQGYNAPQMANTSIGDYIYNSAALRNQQYGQQMQSNASQMGGLYGLGGTALTAAMKYGPMFMSDRRVKRDIREMGIKLVNGLKLYAYRYLNDAKERVGVMADDVLKVNPSAVGMYKGYLTVNYGAL